MKYIKRELANERYLVADTDTGVEEIFTKSALQQYVEGGVEVLGCNLNTGNIYPLFWKKNGESVSKDDFLYLGEWRKEHSNSDSYTRLTGKIYPKGSLGVSAGRKYTFAVSKGLQTELNGENLRFGGTFIEADEGLITGIYKNSEIEVRFKRDFKAIITDIKYRKTVLEKDIEIFITFGKGKFKKVYNLKDISCEVYDFLSSFDETFNKLVDMTNYPELNNIERLHRTRKNCFVGYEITDISFNFLVLGFSPLKRLDYAKLKLDGLKHQYCETKCVQGNWKFYEKNYKDWQDYRADKSVVLSAKRAILGQGVLKISPDGDLFELETDRNNRLKIPNNCKTIQSASLFPNGDPCVVEVGDNVEYVFSSVFDFSRNWGRFVKPSDNRKISFKFDSTKFEVVEALLKTAGVNVGWQNVWVESITGDYLEIIAAGVYLGRLRYTKKACTFSGFCIDKLLQAEDIPKVREIFEREKGDNIVKPAYAALRVFEEWGFSKYGK